MRTLALILCVLVLTTAGDAVAPGKNHPASRHSVLRKYREKILSPPAAARALASGGINTARRYPHEWGGGFRGFATRVGSAFCQYVVKGTIEVGVSALHHEDLRYHRSHLQGGPGRDSNML